MNRNASNSLLKTLTRDSRIERPSWHDYFLMICQMVALRSPDPSCPCGSLITDKNNRIVSLGYNGPPQGILNDKVPLTRPEKYPWMIHAEINALLFGPRDVEGFTLYVTTKPCSTCTAQIIQKKIGYLIHGVRVAKMLNEADIKVSNEMIAASNLKVRVFEEYD